MSAAAESAMIVIFTFRSSLLGINSPRSRLKLDSFHEWATSRSSECVAFRCLDPAAFTGPSFIPRPRHQVHQHVGIAAVDGDLLAIDVRRAVAGQIEYGI